VETAPLTTLLSWAWIAFVIEADNAFEAACASRLHRRPFRISFAMWANGLRCADEDGVTVGELQARARARCNLAGLERWRWIAIGDGDLRRPGFGSHRGIKESTVLRPTGPGSLARRVWPEILEAVERGWRGRFGDDTVETLRRSLAGTGGEMPWSPPEVHPSDGFWTHVTSGATADPDGSAPPLAAALGQALTRLTLDHENGGRASLPLAANAIRLLGDGPVPMRDLPERGGVSKEAIAMATGYLQRRGLAAASDRTISLTAEGRAALDDYRHRAAATDGEPGNRRELRAALVSLLGRSEALSAGLVPPAGCWRGQHPYLKQTKRVLADPTGALPRHPMVLHRGGWPDGS
jgi:hypothetical protein